MCFAGAADIPKGGMAVAVLSGQWLSDLGSQDEAEIVRINGSPGVDSTPSKFQGKVL